MRPQNRGHHLKRQLKHGRYFLRDGYHRAYGLLSAGITHVAALVRDYPSYADAKKHRSRTSVTVTQVT
jgi:hypothetical protein